MFESALRPHKLDKTTFRREEAKLRSALLDEQYDLLESRAFSVLVLVTGADGAGKGEVIQRLYEWLDPRNLRTNAYEVPTDDERERPTMWRYWRDLPPRGEIAIVFGSWYNEPLLARADGRLEAAEFETALAAINDFEQMLSQEGVLLLKFLLQLPRSEQRKRLKKLLASPGGSRHVLEEWSDLEHRKRAKPVAEAMVRRTSTGYAPWFVVPSEDPEYRDLTFGRTILEAVRRRLEQPGSASAPLAPALIPSLNGHTLLDTLDFSQRLDDKAYKKELSALQDRLAALTDREAFQKTALVLVFEGTDAAGKGGSIRRVTAALDPRRFRVYPIAAPNDEEKARPYLWRFWRRLPRRGQTAIFDRSWYGRVLVERVEGFATEPEWLRAYTEINDFEHQLASNGLVVVKFWLATSREEQLRRFKAREKTPYKRYKITPDDWRNRKKWDAYAQAVDDMVDRTSTDYAPWTLVEAEDKKFARIKVLQTICRRLDAVL